MNSESTPIIKSFLKLHQTLISLYSIAQYCSLFLLKSIITPSHLIISHSLILLALIFPLLYQLLYSLYSKSQDLIMFSQILITLLTFFLNSSTSQNNLLLICNAKHCFLIYKLDLNNYK